MTSLPAGSSEQTGNLLLSRLRPDDWGILGPHLEEWSAPSGAVLYSPGDRVGFAYFPRDQSLVSYLVLASNDQAIEAGLVGKEGAVGGIVSQGSLPAYARAVVQQGGPFLRVELSRLEEAKDRSLTIRHLFSRYADCMIAQIFQSVACNAAHSIEQRTAKWLLAAASRTGRANMVLTQEQLASMLGVGRSYLSRVINALRENDAILTHRGRITVNDLDALKEKECKCSSMVAKHFDDVMSGLYSSQVEAAPQVGDSEYT